MKPYISVIVPVYGSRHLIDKCISSICCQTLDNIEIILVDDGNSDGDIPKILDAYAKQDGRINVIHQENHGAGFAINRGIEIAQADYIAEVDCDDYLDLNMYQRLWDANDNCDVVKCGFDLDQDGKRIAYDIFDIRWNGQIVCPRTLSLNDQYELIGACPSMWSAIYRKEFLEKNSIKMRETAGAGFQDTAFTLKTKFIADRYKIITKPYYHYRIDNPNSSTHSHNYLFALADEYDDVERFLKARRINVFWEIFARVKMSGYIWYLNKLTDPEEREQLCLRFVDDINHEIYYKPFYSDEEWDIIQKAKR